jgi:hypothetical protein
MCLWANHIPRIGVSPVYHVLFSEMDRWIPLEPYTYGLFVFVGEFAHICRLLLWVDSPTPVSVMLRPKAVSESVKASYKRR